MSCIKLNENLSISTTGFDPYSRETVHQLLMNIFHRTNLMGNINNRKLPHVHVVHWDMFYPMCSNSGDERVILLTTKENLWSQWVYQFSHEICHHVIDGIMTGEIRGLTWFEETLCETNSLYQLVQVLHVDCNKYPYLHHYGQWVQDYLDDLFQSNPDLKLQLRKNGGIRQWLPLLSEPQHHRDYNNAVACRILPLFVQNPRLWGILSHIGDSRSYSTLEDLLAHLQETADTTGRYSLLEQSTNFAKKLTSSRSRPFASIL